MTFDPEQTSYFIQVRNTGGEWETVAEVQGRRLSGLVASILKSRYDEARTATEGMLRRAGGFNAYGRALGQIEHLSKRDQIRMCSVIDSAERQLSEAMWNLTSAHKERVEAEKRLREAIWDAHEVGYSDDHIGQVIGISRQRVYQIRREE